MRIWNCGMEIRWGSGVTYSAHGLKRPTHTHLWSIMCHVVMQHIPCCHSSGFHEKNPSFVDKVRLQLVWSIHLHFLCSQGKSTNVPRQFLLRLFLVWDNGLRHGRSVHMANRWGCVYTHLMLFHTRVHPLNQACACLSVCLCAFVHLSLFTWIKLIPSLTRPTTRAQSRWK